MKTSKQKLLLSTMVAGFIAGASIQPTFADAGTYECKGGNMCKGQGACGGPGYSCAGNNKCMGKGFIMTKDKAECDAKIVDVKKATKDKKKSVKS